MITPGTASDEESRHFDEIFVADCIRSSGATSEFGQIYNPEI